MIGLVAPEPWNLLVRALVCGLGGMRLASLLVREDGPWDVFDRIRGRFQRPGGELRGIGKMLTCTACTSIWTTSALWAAWYVHPALAAIPAAWGLALMADSIWGRT